MKILKSAMVALLISAVVFVTTGCTASSPTSTPKPQIVTVQRGNISITVTGTGNLALDNTQGLSFGQTGLVSQATTVKVSEVLVVEGQIVEAGAVLVKADTKDWQDQITELQRDLDAKKFSLLRAQADLSSAEYNLKAQKDVKEIQDKIDNTKVKLQQAEVFLREATRSGTSDDRRYWVNMIAKYEADILKYQKDLADLLADPEHSGAASSVTDITNKQFAVQQAQANLVVAQNAVDAAQKALDEEKSSNQEIVAPFRGLITKLNVNKGDIVQRNTNLIEIAEPDKFAANILVTERDVFSIQVGKEASVSLDALPGLNFPAKISKIAPLATIQQGVVNYNVTVELTSLVPRSPADGAGKMVRSSTGGPAVSVSGNPGQAGAVSLKDGLSATVTIPIQQKDDVLLIPSRAVIRQGPNSIVQVMNGDAAEPREVKTGLSDLSNTEIIEGLIEGEQVLVRAASASNSGFMGPQGGPMIVTRQ